MSGREGETVTLDDEAARQLAVHGIVSLERKVTGPEITKVIEPEVKKRGRPAKDASHTTQ